VDLARDGDERAFAEIVARHGPALERYSRRLACGARAEDAVQQTFLSAWSALRRGTEVRELRPWLYRIAHHATLKGLAREGDPTAELPETLAAPATLASEAETRLWLASTLSAVAALPDRQREALIGTAVQGRSRDEMARALGVTDGAVRQLVHRARAAVRAAAAVVVPWPLMLRFSRGRGGARLLPERADLAAAGGSVGVAAAAMKVGAAVTVAGTLVVAPVPLTERRAEPARAATSPAPVADRGLARLASGVLAAPWYAPPAPALSERPGSGPDGGNQGEVPVDFAAAEEPAAAEDPADSAYSDPAATDGEPSEPVAEDEAPAEDAPADGEEEPAPEDPPVPEEEPPSGYVEPVEEPIAVDEAASASPDPGAEPPAP
jgi:RNA polymerase sigma factor (sigma-70 family)